MQKQLAQRHDSSTCSQRCASPACLPSMDPQPAWKLLDKQQGREACTVSRAPSVFSTPAHTNSMILAQVPNDERAAVAFDLIAASVPALLRMCYPALYQVGQAEGDWGRAGKDGR